MRCGRTPPAPATAEPVEDLCATWDEYLAQFAEAGDQAAIGDVSPSYFAYPELAEAIRDRLGSPRIVLILREPVQKAFSQYSHLVRDGRETLPFWEALQAEPERCAKGYGALWRYVERRRSTPSRWRNSSICSAASVSRSCSSRI